MRRRLVLVLALGLLWSPTLLLQQGKPTAKPAVAPEYGAYVYDDAAFFPHGSDVLRAGDRVIMFVESSSAWGAARIL